MKYCEKDYFRRFNSLDLEYVYTDKHIHSEWTDGRDSISKIAEKAEDLDLRIIAIVDHLRKDSAYFEEYSKEIKQVAKKSKVVILTGFEAKIEDFQGNIDVSEKNLRKAQIKVASVHRFPVAGKLYFPNEFKKRVCQEIELALTVPSIKKRRFNVIGHPGGMSLQAYGEFPLDFFEEIIRECKKSGIAFEINSKYHLPVLKSLKRLLKIYNPLVSLGSDAHKIEDLGRHTDILRKVAIDE